MIRDDFSHSDELKSFSAHVEQAFDRRQPHSFSTCESAFRNVVASDLVSSSVRQALRNLLERPLQKGNWTANQIILDRGPGWALAIALFEQPSRYIHSTPFFAMYAPLAGTSLAFDRYRLPSSYQNPVFNPSIVLERIEGGVIPSGEILIVDPAQDVHDFKIGAPQLLLKFTSSAWHFLEWLFDRTSLRAVQANDAALSTTQLRVASYLLGRLGQASSIDPLKAIADHPIPNVRWAAIQNLGRLDVAAALPYLQKALSDPHPHIRRAAEKSLTQAGLASGN